MQEESPIVTGVKKTLLALSAAQLLASGMEAHKMNDWHSTFNPKVGDMRKLTFLQFQVSMRLIRRDTD